MRVVVAGLQQLGVRVVMVAAVLVRHLELQHLARLTRVVVAAVQARAVQAAQELLLFLMQAHNVEQAAQLLLAVATLFTRLQHPAHLPLEDNHELFCKSTNAY